MILFVIAINKKLFSLPQSNLVWLWWYNLFEDFIGLLANKQQQQQQQQQQKQQHQQQ